MRRDFRKAMQLSFILATRAHMPQEGPLSWKHIVQMIDKADNDPLFSYGKGCTWLGWIQCAIVASYPINEQERVLKRMKEINRSSKCEDI